MTGGTSRGYLTIALGPARYVHMARWLLLSLRRVAPGIPLAVVTDSSNRRLLAAADVVIPPTDGIESPFLHKLWINEYSPFDQTVFVDADCVAVRDPGDVWQRYGDHSVGAFGVNRAIGPWFMDLKVMCELTGSTTIPTISGGLVRFDQSQTSAEIYISARAWWHRLPELGSVGFRGTWADEPALALALAERGIPAYDSFEDETYRTTIRNNVIDFDVLRNVATLQTTSGLTKPAIVHFANSADHPAYRRAGRELSLTARRIPVSLARLAARASN